MTHPHSPRFDFDRRIDRGLVPALKVDPSILGSDHPDMFAAAVADMDFEVAPCVQEAIARRAAHAIYGYERLPEGLIPALTRWMAERHGWEIDPRHVLRSPNVLNSLAMAVNLFTAPDDEIILQPPMFFDFAEVIVENGRRVLEAPLIFAGGRYEMDFDALDRVASEPRASLMFLCNPHNPVGRVWSREELTRVGEICRRHGVLVVSDEIHADIAFPGSTHTPFVTVSDADAANSITCLSPAKSFNIASCCSAFTVIPDATRRSAFAAENSRLTVNKNNAFASVAMQAAYEGGGPWLDALLVYLAGNLDLVRARLAALPGVTLVEPEGTFLIWVDFRGLGMEPDALVDSLKHDARWSIMRGTAFGAQGAGFGRVNIACPRAELSAALDSLAAAVEKRFGT